MHYNEDVHADLVSTQSRTLDLKVETIGDHAAFINFKEGVLNSIDSEISSNLSDFGKFILFSDGVQEKFN